MTTTVTWKGGNGNWTDNNWTGTSTYPQTSDDAVVLPAFASGAYTVTDSSSTPITLDALTLGTAATLVLNGASITSNQEITVAGGAIQANASAKLIAGSGIALTAGAELDVQATATVTVSSNFTADASTIHLYGATMSVTNGVVLSNSASFIGYGELSGTNDSITGSGTVTASGGPLTLDGGIGSTINLVVGAGTTLALNSTYGIGAGSGSGPTLTFTNASGQTDIFQAVKIGQGQLFIGPISSFSQGDFIDVQKFGPGDTVSYSGSTVTIAGNGGSQVYTFSAVGSLTGTQIAAEVVASSSTTGASGGAIRTTTVGGYDQLSICFMPGTLIRTPDGEALIETVQRGDLVLTADGEAKPVVWVGRQTIVSRFADPVRNLPIRIAAGALADNLPSRDLLVSPEHALLVEGVLVHAGALVNGSSIRRESRVPDTFIYYHVELEDHSLVLAENVPAETFVDNVDRRHFDNWAEHEALYPEGRAVAELPLPRAKAVRQVPLSIRAALADRAAALGLSEAA